METAPLRAGATPARALRAGLVVLRSLFRPQQWHRAVHAGLRSQRALAEVPGHRAPQRPPLRHPHGRGPSGLGLYTGVEGVAGVEGADGGREVWLLRRTGAELAVLSLALHSPFLSGEGGGGGRL